ncbi:MAG: triosephosphate isomerase [Proteobacteria bacterium]|nr:triosephosphate isomerase [Pseudomonadota bacterium]
MTEIHVNLKRFDVPKKLGGICLFDSPGEWIEFVIDESIKAGLGTLPNTSVTYFLPEALLLAGIGKLSSFPAEKRTSIHIGCQGVYRENVEKNGNFGAFTTNLPAAAAVNLGCSWTIVAHSEERRDKTDLLSRFQPAIQSDPEIRRQANHSVEKILNQELICALKSGLNAVYCVGETAEEKGGGGFEEQKPRIEAVLSDQLEIGLKGVSGFFQDRKITIGYEPRWAIGPGKTPPGSDYIGFVSDFIKSTVKNLYGFAPPVIYGGGLKEDNAASISEIEAIDGGLVALTKFTGDIGFEPGGLKRIIDAYLAGI